MGECSTDPGNWQVRWYDSALLSEGGGSCAKNRFFRPLLPIIFFFDTLRAVFHRLSNKVLGAENQTYFAVESLPGLWIQCL